MKSKIVAIFLLLTFSSCYEKVEGCLDPAALNFDLNADENCCCTYPDLLFEVLPFFNGRFIQPGLVVDDYEIRKFYMTLSNIKVDTGEAFVDYSSSYCPMLDFEEIYTIRRGMGNTKKPLSNLYKATVIDSVRWDLGVEEPLPDSLTCPDFYKSAEYDTTFSHLGYIPAFYMHIDRDTGDNYVPEIFIIEDLGISCILDIDTSWPMAENLQIEITMDLSPVLSKWEPAEGVILLDSLMRAENCSLFRNP